MTLVIIQESTVWLVLQVLGRKFDFFGPELSQVQASGRKHFLPVQVELSIMQGPKKYFGGTITLGIEQ